MEYDTRYGSKNVKTTDARLAEATRLLARVCATLPSHKLAEEGELHDWYRREGEENARMRRIEYIEQIKFLLASGRHPLAALESVVTLLTDATI